MKHIFDFLDDHLKEFFEERAGILEHDAGYPKEKAEAIAKAETDSWAKHRLDIVSAGGVSKK